jgi:PBS lyase HEAT-like repeat-containing protein
MTQPARNIIVPLSRGVGPWAVAAALAVPAAADTFILEHGGQIEGQWLNREEQPLTKYEVRTGGVTLTLPLGQVKEAIHQTPAELDYARRAPQTPDTVESQWELAEWCRKSSLARQREVHLRRVIELNPNHQQARFALGYQFHKGQWTTQANSRRQEGYELYRGKWRTPQEIEILESRSRNELAEKEWLARLKRWRRELDDRDKSRLAYDSLTAIKDPIAVGPIGEVFRRERARNVKAIYADVLAAIRTTEALKILVEQALGDPDEEVFYYCLGKLSQLTPPHIADPFIAALKDNNNVKVNRASIALGKLGDKSAISPLIDALVTTHTQVIDNGEYTTTTFSSSGAAAAKGDGLELKVFHIQNQPALDALSKLTGADFGFDQRAWRYWHAQEKIASEASKPSVDARRD